MRRLAGRGDYEAALWRVAKRESEARLVSDLLELDVAVSAQKLAYQRNYAFGERYGDAMRELALRWSKPFCRRLLRDRGYRW